MTPLSDDDLIRHARRRVGLKMGFGVHALVYVLVNLGLFVVNLVAGGPRWHGWPLLGWGIGLAVHGIVTLVALRGEGLRARLLAREIERLQSDRRAGPSGAGR